MTLVGAEVADLARGSCTLAVTGGRKLLQQYGLFHGGVTRSWWRVPTIDCGGDTSSAQAALTAEYKLTVVTRLRRTRLICRARVIGDLRTDEGHESLLAEALANFWLRSARSPVLSSLMAGSGFMKGMRSNQRAYGAGDQNLGLVPWDRCGRGPTARRRQKIWAGPMIWLKTVSVSSGNSSPTGNQGRPRPASDCPRVRRAFWLRCASRTASVHSLREISNR